MTEQTQKKKNFPIFIVILCGAAFLLFGVYAGGMHYYKSHFLPGTVIDGMDVSGMTLGELEENIQNYMLRIVERKADGSTLEEDIQGRDISLGYAAIAPIKEIMDQQNTGLWFVRKEHIYDRKGHLSWREEFLEEKVRGLVGFQEPYAVAPTDAYIADYSPENGFAVVPETQGSLLDPEKTYQMIRDAVSRLEPVVNLESAGCYVTPAVTTESSELLAALEEIQRYRDVNITYLFGENREILDGDTISSWLVLDGFDVSLDQDQVNAYVATLRRRYDSIFRPRTFLTSYGKEITIDGGDYGWWMNYGQEQKELAAMIERGESGERTPLYYQTAAVYGQPDYGTTYVEINLTAQHLFFYQDGEMILESDFVSGNSRKGYDTPVGVYSITYKQRNATLTGEDYETPVSYWMPFNRNVGMHDASWRRVFGGNIYKTNGSHGCINLPPSVAEELYGYVSKGTPVICYELPGTEPISKEKGEK